jgi:hypothetical protein
MSTSNQSNSQRNALRARIRTPASEAIPFPVEPRPQDLPIAQITWQNFEKLCLRLIEKNLSNRMLGLQVLNWE